MANRHCPQWHFAACGSAAWRPGSSGDRGAGIAGRRDRAHSVWGAESTATALEAPPPQAAEASNGGTASATTSGDVDIGQIITGENTGNSIVTGDISGSAEISGGEIDYPPGIPD